MAKRDASYFFDVTNVTRADGSEGGVRFRKFDKPTEQVMRDFTENVYNVENITYAALVVKINNSALVFGKKYCITDYKTIHIIPSTAVTNTGAIEAITVTATSSNTISREASSSLYPNDYIEYDYTNTTLEDSTANARNGFITKRIDRVKNLSTPYDFRVVKFRRWAIDGTGLTAWATSISYVQDNVRYVAGDGVYRCQKAHTSGTFATDKSTYWVRLIDFGLTKYWGWSSTNISVGGFTIAVNASDFQDNLTFTNTVANNITIDNYTIAGVRTLNNIVLYGSSLGNNIKFGLDCYKISAIVTGWQNVTFEGNDHELILNNSIVDCTFGLNNSNGVIEAGFSESRFGDHITNFSLGTGCSVWVIDGETDGMKGGNSCLWVKVGLDTGGNLITNSCNDVLFSSNCYNNKIYSSSFMSLTEVYNMVIDTCSEIDLFKSGTSSIANVNRSIFIGCIQVTMNATGKTYKDCNFIAVRFRAFTGTLNGVGITDSREFSGSGSLPIITHSGDYSRITVNKVSPDASLFFTKVDNATPGTVAITAMTAGTPTSVHAATHGLSTGDIVVIAGVVATSSLATINNAWTVTVVDADNFTLNSSSTAGTYTSGGTIYKSVSQNTQYLKMI